MTNPHKKRRKELIKRGIIGSSSTAILSNVVIRKKPITRIITKGGEHEEAN